MPIKIQSDLPVKEILEKENLFVMDENRAMHQDIRPIYILILNLMPLKEETELQLLRSLSNTPLQVDVSFMAVESHQAKNTSKSHLNKFYKTFSELKDKKFDGMIITGAPVEQMEFEEVDYWEEITRIMDWSETHVTSTIFLCWAAQAALYHFYGLKKRMLDKKMFGLFWHKVMNRKIPLVRGFDDVFWHHIPDIQRFPSRTSMPARSLLFWLSPMRLAISLLWQRTAARYLLWGIRNMIASPLTASTNVTLGKVFQSKCRKITIATTTRRMARSFCGEPMRTTCIQTG